MMEYLIHEDSFFCVNSNSIKHRVGNETIEISLDNLESKLLEYFVIHQGKVISKDELMRLWHTQYVMEHSLTRVISTLRKKLDSLNNLASLIKTIPREGYQYIGTATIEYDKVTIADVVSPNGIVEKRPSSFSYKPTYILIMALLAALLVISTMWSNQVKTNAVTQPYVYEIMDNGSLKEDATMNPDGEILVYASVVPGNNWSLKIVSSNSLFSRHHQIKGYDLIAPTWLDKETLVYVLSNSEHCSIRQINIYKDPEGDIGRQISGCNVKDPSRALLVLNSNTLLVSESPSFNIPKKLVTIDIDTGEKSSVHQVTEKGTGAYRLFISPNKEFIATLSSKNWFDTDIQVFSTTSFTEPVWHQLIDYPLFSVALGNENIVFKDETGRFNMVNFMHQKEDNKNTVPLVITRPVYSPTYAKNGFFFTEGDKFNHKVVLENFTDGEHAILNEVDSVSLRSPLLLKNGTVLLYASNQTGINQIWTKNLTSGQHEQISNFDTSYFIEGLTVNAEETDIAIDTNRGIILGKFDVIGKIISQQIISGNLPSFWRNRLLYSKTQDGKSIVYSFSSDNEESYVLLDNGAYKTIVDGHNLFYSKYHGSGIWQYKKEEPDILVFNPVSSFVGDDWDVFGGVIYTRDQNGTVKKFIVEGDNAHYSEPIEMDCHKLNIVAENQCLYSIGKASANRLLRYSFD